MSTITTILASHHTQDGKRGIFIICAMEAGGAKTYKVQVMIRKAETGECYHVAYESSGSREWCFKTFNTFIEDYANVA